MPPRKKIVNAQYAQWLLDEREKFEPGDSKWFRWNNAYKSMAAHPVLLASIDDARDLQGIATATIEFLKRKVAKDSGGADQDAVPPPLQPKKRSRVAKDDARPTKRSASDSVAQRAQVAERREERVELRSSRSMPPPRKTADQLRFWYLDSTNERVSQREEGYIATTADETDLGYRIEIHAEEGHIHVHSILELQCLNNRRIGILPLPMAEKFDVATLPVRNLGKQLQNDPQGRIGRKAITLDPSRQGSSATVVPKKTSAVTLSRSSAASLSLDEVEIIPIPVLKHTSKVANPSRTQSVASSSRAPNIIPRSQTLPTISSRPAAKAPPLATRHAPDFGAALAIQQTGNARLSGVIPNLPSTQDDDSFELDSYLGFEDNSTEFVPFTPTILRSHEYEIKLILDIRERDTNQVGLFDSLRKRNLPVEQKCLSIGDLGWIARRKDTCKRGDEFDEVWLDCVLERKRLDDLKSSIKDGRFHEQKFRLHQSGITRVFYVVEDYQNERNMADFEQNIFTALSSTQAVDCFMVRETKKLLDTVSLYNTLHGAICNDYKDKDLYVLPSYSIKRHTYLAFQKHLRRSEPNRSYLTSYASFEFLNSKSGFTTVQTTWAKMLLTINGLSAEKVGVIIQHFSTPRSLYDYFAEQEKMMKRGLEREKVEGFPKGKRKSCVKKPWEDLGALAIASRKVGLVNAEKIYRVMRGLEYEKN